MIPPDYIELMNGEIDGTNSPTDSQRLETFLATHPEVRTHFRELREAVGIFDQVSLLEPPARLRQRILSAVGALYDRMPAPDAHGAPDAPDAPDTAGATAKSGGLKAFLRNLRTRPGYRLAFTTGFAVSLLLTVMVWQLTSQVGLIPSSDLSGAILREVESGRGARSESVTIDLAGIEGTVQTYHAGDRTLIRIVLTSDRTVQVRLRCNGPIACESYRAAGPGRGEFAVADRHIELTHTGEGEYDIVLQHAAALTPEILLQILENQTVLSEVTITRKHD
jgi:hypothetical protein